MSALEMKSLQFRQQRESNWVELELLIEKIEADGIRMLSADELSRLPLLYRHILSSLSVARSISLDHNVTSYLESLSRRSYLAVYGIRGRFLRTISQFLLMRFPQIVRFFKWHVLLALSFFISGVWVGFVATSNNPDNYYTIVPKTVQQNRNPTSTQEELRAILYDDSQKKLIDQLWTFTTFLFTHNTQIGILSFSIGILFGVPVFYLLFTNGQTLGSMAAIYNQQDLSWDFWAWILPHGITEIGAIILCGAGGLMLTFALIFPGKYSRLSNLAIIGRHAGIMILGAILMFFLAALIEGLFRQLVHSILIRYCVALGTFTFWTLYFLYGGKILKTVDTGHAR